MTEKTAERLVRDSHAVLAFLEGEPAGRQVAQVLTKGEPWMNLINLGEAVYVVERNRGKAAADDLYAFLLAGKLPGGGVPIRWLPVDSALVRRAASLKAAGGLSYADCFAAASAAILGCPILTGDPEFRAAERAGIAVVWL